MANAIHNPGNTILAICVRLLSMSALGAEPLRLVLQITVDALRGDLPQRH